MEEEEVTVESKLPDVIYIRRDPADPEYFITGADIDTHAELGAEVIVSEYRLVRTLAVTASVVAKALL